MYFWSVCFGGELGFVNCDGINICVVKNQFELPKVVFDPFMLTCSMMRMISFYFWVCVVLVLYVDAVLADTAMLVWGMEEVWLW